MNNRSCFLRAFYRLLQLAGLSAAFMAKLAYGDIALSASTFTQDNLPSITADSAEMTTINSLISSYGGYYKLRAKILVTYDPGYFHAIDTANNQYGFLSHVPGPGNYVVQLYYVVYTASGSMYLGQFYSKNITILGGPATGTMGLKPTYFPNMTLTAPGTTPKDGDGRDITEAPGGAWASAGPLGVNVGVDNFSVRWEGQIETFTTGNYTFWTGSDDGMQVFITDMSNKVAGQWNTQPYIEYSGTKYLAGEQRHQIKVEFFENTGDATAKLFWQPPGGQKHIVPITRFTPPGAANATPTAPMVLTHPGAADISAGMQAVFYVVASGHPAPTYQWRKDGQPITNATSSTYTIASAQPQASGTYDVVVTNASGTATSNGALLVVNPNAPPGQGTGLRGAYYIGENFGGLVVSRIDNQVNFGWGTNSPYFGVPNDHFSARWFGTVEAESSGSYGFAVNVDDGVRLYVNGQKIIDRWEEYVQTARSQTIYLPAGVKVPIMMEFFEKGGYANATLYWRHPGRGNDEIIPRERLYPGTMTVGGWSEFMVASGILEFTEDQEEDENGNWNGNGNYSAIPGGHTIFLPQGGKLRVISTSAANLHGGVYPQFMSPFSIGNGGNINAEFSLPAGSHYIEIGATYQGSQYEEYTINIEFQADAVPTALETPPEITSGITAGGNVGTAFTGYTITATGAGTLHYVASNLPPGLAVNSSTGVITGTPTSAGTYPNVVIYVYNQGGMATRVVNIKIDPPIAVPQFTNAAVADAAVSSTFSFKLTTNPAALTYTATGLPAGLTLTGDTISGTPTQSGTFNVTLVGNNALGDSLPFTLTITVGVAGTPVIRLIEPVNAVRQP